MAELQRIDASKPIDWEKVWKIFDEDGGVVMEGFISPDLLARLNDDFADIAAAHSAGSAHDDERWAEVHGVNTKRITCLPVHSRAWVEVMCDERYQMVGDRFLDTGDYQLNTAQLICLGPGESPQLLHRDEANWMEAVSEKEITITANFALTDFTEDNGATIVAPGSHKWEGGGVWPDVPEDKLCRATMPAGSVFIYRGKLVHGGGPNVTSDVWRLAVHTGFVRGWLRPEENHQLSVPLEVAKTLPERAQYLLGFRSYTPAGGARLGLVNYDDASLLLD